MVQLSVTVGATFGIAQVETVTEAGIPLKTGAVLSRTYIVKVSVLAMSIVPSFTVAV